MKIVSYFSWIFLDFLGFRELIDDTIENPSRIQEITDAIDHLAEIADETEFYPTQRVTQFSDSMVVSYAVHERSAVFELLNDIAFCLVDLVERGFLLRGAVTCGDLLHTKKHLLGPAMVRAYELESKCARFPRVIIDENVFIAASGNPALHHESSEELAYIKGFLRQDEDGMYFLDYVSWDAVVATIGGEEEMYSGYLEKIAELLRVGLTHRDPRVLEKYLWLHRHYVSAIQFFENVPPSSEHRHQNTAIYADIMSLPQLSKEAELATKLVQSQDSSTIARF